METKQKESKTVLTTNSGFVTSKAAADLLTRTDQTEQGNYLQ